MPRGSQPDVMCFENGSSLNAPHVKNKSKPGRMCSWGYETEASFEPKYKECAATAIAWGVSISIWPDSICIALLCSPKQLPEVKDTKNPEKNILEPESVISLPETSHCRPRRDPGADRGHLLTGEAKKSTGVLAAIGAPRT